MFKEDGSEDESVSFRVCRLLIPMDKIKLHSIAAETLGKLYLPILRAMFGKCCYLLNLILQSMQRQS